MPVAASCLAVVSSCSSVSALHGPLMMSGVVRGCRLNAVCCVADFSIISVVTGLCCLNKERISKVYQINDFISKTIGSKIKEYTY